MLCLSLVLKQTELVLIFYSFVGSFIAALILSGYFESTTVFSSAYPKKISNETKRFSNAYTKVSVGILACSISICILFNVSTNGWSNNAKLSSEFISLSTVTGYLAFELWFMQLFCHPPPYPLSSIFENAVTLTSFSILLTKWGSSFQITKTHLLSWISYKTIRLILEERNRSKLIALSQQQLRTKTYKENQKGNNYIEGTKKRKKQVKLWTIHGQNFDFSEFVRHHPGGTEAIKLGQGRDCTALFESYHPFTDKHRLILDKYSVKPCSKAKVNSSKIITDKFYEVLKFRVRNVLKEKGIDPERDRCATFYRTSYYTVILCGLFVSGFYHIQGNPLASFLFAFFGWLIGSLGHDAGHFAVSRKPLVNDVCVWGMSFLCNPIMWQHQHTYAHHSYTNEFEHDPDLHHFQLLLRVHRNFQYNKVYKQQVKILYVIFAYALVVVGECIKIPIGMIKTGFLYDMVEYTDKNRPMRAFGMLAHYVSYLVIIIFIPIFMSKSWFAAFLCPTIHMATAGWMFGVFSQINHLNEMSVETSKGATDNKLLRESWAARQVSTSNNFAIGSTFWHVLSNGLNLQIEHHLFPGLNHCHLHTIAPIVRETCEEYGVEYKSFESWGDIMGATLKWLGQLSEDDISEGVKTS